MIACRQYLDRMTSIKENVARQNRGQHLIAVLIFCGTLLISYCSPVRVMSDSKYSMFLSESLLRNHSFELQPRAFPNLEIYERTGYNPNTSVYQVDLVRDRLFYYFPPGSSLLSLPYVGLMRLLGISTFNADGSYNPRRSWRFSGAGGNPNGAPHNPVLLHVTDAVISGLERGSRFECGIGNPSLEHCLESLVERYLGHTAAGNRHLPALAHEIQRRALNAVTLATVLSWMYLVRPTNALVIVAVTVYVLLFCREIFLRYANVGAAWFGVLVLYSFISFGEYLPHYFRAGRLRLDDFGVAIRGNLVSPSRGLLVFVPVTLFVAYLLIFYRGQLSHRRLIWLSLAICLSHLLVVSCFVPWHGGGCFGPRYTTGVVPLMFLLAVLGIKGRNEWQVGADGSRPNFRRRIEAVAGILLLAASIFINGRGAMSYETSAWNAAPVSVDQKPSRVLEWNYPQFLAGLISPPLPAVIAPLELGDIDLTGQESDKYLWYGWSGPEQGFRWTDGRRAAMVFSWNQRDDLTLLLKLSPMLIPEKVKEQVVSLDLNGRKIGSYTLLEEKDYELAFELPGALLANTNTIIIHLPNASLPPPTETNLDLRRLAVSVKWMRVLRKNE